MKRRGGMFRTHALSPRRGNRDMDVSELAIESDDDELPVLSPPKRENSTYEPATGDYENLVDSAVTSECSDSAEVLRAFASSMQAISRSGGTPHSPSPHWSVYCATVARPCLVLSSLLSLPSRHSWRAQRGAAQQHTTQVQCRCW